MNSYNNYDKYKYTVLNRGEVYFADLPIDGHVQGGKRPVLVVQNNKGAQVSPNAVVVPITTKTKREDILTHVEIKAGEGGLSKDSIAACETILTIGKFRLLKYIGIMPSDTMEEISAALRYNFAL